MMWRVLAVLGVVAIVAIACALKWYVGGGSGDRGAPYPTVGRAKQGADEGTAEGDPLPVERLVGSWEMVGDDGPRKMTYLPDETFTQTGKARDGTQPEAPFTVTGTWGVHERKLHHFSRTSTRPDLWYPEVLRNRDVLILDDKVLTLRCEDGSVETWHRAK